MATSQVIRKAAVWSLKKKIAVYGGTFIGIGSTVAVVRSVDSVEDLRQVGFIRFGRAVVTVSKIVVDYKSSLRGLYYPSIEYDEAMQACHQRSADRLLQLACSNGGIFIKVGQHLAALEYLVPTQYSETLSVLMAKAPQASYEDVEFVVEQQLGKKINELFTDFERTPIGAASLAQVHIAKLKETGEKVAVKVQHRRVYKNSRTDSNTMEFLAHVAAKLFPEFQLMWLVNEVKKNLPNELDFLHEAGNCEKVRIRFRHLKFLKIPKIYYEYSTPRVLTMECCEGEHISNIEYIDKNKIDKHDICRKMGRMISEMIFLAGYLHADPHPGNILVNKKRNGKVEIALLDHGLYLDIDDRFRDLYTELWLALLKPDQEKLKKVAKDMGVGELYGLFACMVTRRSWKSVTQGIGKKNLDKSERDELKQYAASLIPQISEVLQRMPREMLLILKTNDLLRNIEHLLGTSSREDSLLEMSKCVVRSHHDLALKKATCWTSRVQLNISMFWSLFKIHTYEYYLILKDLCSIRPFSIA